MISQVEDWDALAEDLSALPSGDALDASIQALEAELRSVKPRLSRLLRDTVAVDFAAQVLEAAKGVRALAASDAKRTAYPVARRGFEAFHELLELMAIADDGDAAAAEAFVLSVFSLAENQGLLDRAGKAWGFGRENDGAPSAREFLRQRAAALDTRASSAGEAVSHALRVRDQKGTPKKLDGGRRARINSLRSMPEFSSIAPVFDTYWSSLSIESHPYVRLGSAVLLTPEGLTVLLDPEEAIEGPIEVAWILAYHAGRLCRKYLRPDLES